MMPKLFSCRRFHVAPSHRSWSEVMNDIPPVMHRVDEPNGVTVILPCYNGGRYLRDALESVFAQDYGGPLEVIVGDDGSVDNSLEIVSSFGSRLRLVHRSEGEIRGPSANRNRCLREASQPLVAFIDQDDLWTPTHVSALSRALSERPDAGLAYDLGFDISPTGGIYGPRPAQPHRPLRHADDLLLTQSFTPCAVMARRSVFDRVGYFDESFLYAQDHDMWLRVLEVFPAVHVPAHGFFYRLHSQQLSQSSALWTDSERVLAKACERYPYRRSTIRKRKAVLAYRKGEIALHQRNAFRAGVHFLASAALDPTRAARQVAITIYRGVKPLQKVVVNEPRNSSPLGSQDQNSLRHE